MNETSNYPNISDILARKAKGREAASKRSFAEKTAIVEAHNARLAPLKAARDRRVEKLKDFTEADMAAIEASEMSLELDHLNAELGGWKP